MSFSSGTFTLIYDWTTEAASSDPRIVASEVQAEFVGVANGLSTCILKDGSQTVTANIPFNGNKLTGVGDPTSAQDAATKTYVDGLTDDIALSKMADLAQYRVIGRIASGTGIPQALTPDNLLAVLGQATSSETIQATLTLSQPLTVQGTITSTANVTANTYNTASATGNGYQLAQTGVLRVQRPNSAADTDGVFVAYRGTGLVAQIEANGDFQSATNSYGATSDRSAKREIGDMNPTLEQIMSLPLRKGKLNLEYAVKGASAPTREFVIADEMEDAGFGDLVKAQPDGLKSVNYSGLYFKGLMALQELTREYRSEIAALKDRISTLEGR